MIQAIFVRNGITKLTPCKTHGITKRILLDCRVTHGYFPVGFVDEETRTLYIRDTEIAGYTMDEIKTQYETTARKEGLEFDTTRYYSE